jgi:hypothetical protein
VNVPLAPAEERLVKLGNAYVSAALRLGRAPEDFNDLKPELGDVTEDFLRSAGDGQPFVVLWGVDYNKLPPQLGNPFTVGA